MLLLLVLGSEKVTLPVTDAHQDVDHTHRAPNTSNSESAANGQAHSRTTRSEMEFATHDGTAEARLHIKNFCLSTPLVLGGVVAIPFLTPIVEDWALAPRLNMVPQLMF